MNYLDAILLSAVEGVTEFLPISSTAHLIVVGRLISIPSSEFVKSFEVVIQLGAIMAVVLKYFSVLWKSPVVWVKAMVAFTPTAVVGVVLYPVVKGLFLSNVTVSLMAMFAGGILLVVWDRLWKPTTGMTVERLPWSKVAWIGVVQSVSIVPGVSRAAAAIVGGLMIGLNRKEATRFSFFLAVPTLAGASALEIYKGWGGLEGNWGVLIVGFVGSFVTAYVVIDRFIKYVEGNSFVVFGIYRIVLSIVMWSILVHA